MFHQVGFGKKELGQVCSKIVDGSHAPPKGIDRSEFVMLSSQNIFENGLDLTDVRCLAKDDFDKEYKRTDIKAGDVLLTIVGTIGRTYIVKETDPKITLQRSVAVLQPGEEISSVYLQSVLKYDENFQKEAHGNAQKGIYLGQLSSYPVIIPPIELQNEFERIYNQADKSGFVSSNRGLSRCFQWISL